jgi:hypothetical protein
MSQFSVKWIFELDRDYSINILAHLPASFTTPCAFEDSSGKRRLELYPDGTLKILASYAWDGCTPKVGVWDILLGTPDGIPNIHTRKPKAYYASLVHDTLYQFLPVGLPIARKEVDKIFFELLERDDFAPRWVYYAAVRLLGGGFRHLTHWKRSYQGKKVDLRMAEVKDLARQAA